MNVLVVAATKFEIEPLLNAPYKPDILITGVGIAPTIFHLTKNLSDKKYSFVIQAGIAGTFTKHFSLAEVAAVKEDTFGDTGIEENGKLQTLFENGFAGKNDFPFMDGWLVNNSALFEKSGLPVARGITVNKLTDNPTENKLRKEKFSAGIESMEGAAFHYVCLQQKVNFLQLRSISNVAGERDKANWKTKEAIKNLNEELIKTIKTLTK